MGFKKFLCHPLCVGLFTINLSAQRYPLDHFRHPLDIPLSLAGTFGELRKNHFHSGIDIKTDQRSGHTVYAAADGYLSRIKISPTGYGKALYITHENGFTTVYAHLQAFIGDIALFAKKKQYERKTFELDLSLRLGLFPIKKGQPIALSGNSGASAGAHLHFEVRETKTEKPVNPLHFGYMTPSAAPVIEAVYLYPISGVVNGVEERYKISFEDDMNQPKPIPAAGTIGLGVTAAIREDKNKNGPYAVDLYVNDERIFNFTADTFAFDETRYANAQMDYAALLTEKKWIHKCFIEPGNALGMYLVRKNDGYINLEPGKDYAIRLVVSDHMGHQSTATFTIAGNSFDKPLQKPSGQLFRWKEENTYRTPYISLHFPEKSFYKDVYLDFQSANDRYQIGDENIPVHKPYEIVLLPENFPLNLLNKAVLAKIDPQTGKIRKTLTGHISNGRFQTKARELGTYTLLADTTAPEIVPLNTKRAKAVFSSKRPRIKLRLRDDLSGVSAFNAFIDGRWVLADYDAKNNLLTIDLVSENIPAGRHILKVRARDRVGNTNRYKTQFVKR